jgi:hypothetical protein
MQMGQSQSETQQLGDAITSAYEVSSSVSSDRTTASKLAARHLERVLVSGANARLVAAIRDLANELAPSPARTSRSHDRGLDWARERLPVAR